LEPVTKFLQLRSVDRSERFICLSKKIFILYILDLDSCSQISLYELKTYHEHFKMGLDG